VVRASDGLVAEVMGKWARCRFSMPMGFLCHAALLHGARAFGFWVRVLLLEGLPKLSEALITRWLDLGAGQEC